MLSTPASCTPRVQVARVPVATRGFQGASRTWPGCDSHAARLRLVCLEVRVASFKVRVTRPGVRVASFKGATGTW